MMSVPSPLKRPRWQKVLSDLWESRMRTLLVVASIAVGVFAIGTMVTAYVIINDDLSVTYSASNPANIEIWTDPFDDNLINAVARIPGVAEVEGRHSLKLRISRNGGQTWDNLDVIAIEDFAETTIFQRTKIAGNPIPGRREMVMEQLALRFLPFELGDTLTVQLPDGTVRDLPFVGIVADQGVLGGPDTTAVGYVTMDTLEWLGQPQYFNRIYATVEGDGNDDLFIETVSDLVKEKIEEQESQTYRTLLNQTTEHPMKTTVLAVLSVLGAMGGLMLILGSSLIANTLNALLSQHLRQIGVMKLVGARSFQILSMYIVLIVAFSLIALFVSIPLASVAGYGLSTFLAGELKITLQGFRVIPLAVVVQAIIALTVPLIAGYLPVNSGSKTTVENALSEDQGGEGDGESWLDRLGEQITWLSRPILVSIRNTFRRKGRLALTLFTLTMAGAIFIGVFNVQASLGGFINSIGNLFLADVAVDFTKPYRISRIEQAVGDIAGITAVEGWLVGNGEIVDGNDNVENNITLFAPPAASELVKPKILVGRWLQVGDDHAAVIPDTIYETYPNIQVGDTIRLSVNGKRSEPWTVVGIFSFPSPGDEAWIGYTTYETMSDLLHLPDQATSFRLTTDIHTYEYQQNMSQIVDARLRQLGLKLSGVEAGLTTVTQASEAITILVSFFLIMAILTAFVGSIGLAGTMSMNVLERTREIGIMRAIGAQDSEIVKSVVVEGVFIGIISWGLGVIVSFPISFILLRIISLALINTPMDLIFSFNGFGLWLVVVLILAILASVIPARNAARLTIREVLAYE
jgi:putative ABC transport system permease protein